MTADESFSLQQIKQVSGARESLILEWARAFKPVTMEDSIEGHDAAILGAVLAMKLRSPAKDGELRSLLRELIAHSGPADDWVVVRRVRGRPQIERPPVRIDVSSSLKARPVIYDPITFLQDLRQLAS